MFKYTYVGNLRHVRVLCVRAGLFEVRADGVGSLRDRQQPWRIDTLWHLFPSAWLVTSLM